MMLQPKELRAWARMSRAGDSTIYFRGDAALAQKPEPLPGRKSREEHANGYRWARTRFGHRLSPLSATDQAGILAILQTARLLREGGWIELVRRKRGEHDYEYIAQRTAKRKRAVRAVETFALAA